MTKKATASAIKRLLPREQMVALSDLVPADYNPRDITEEALSGLRESIKRWGLVQNIVWNRRTGNIVGGHQRRRALLAILAELADAGEVRVPCKVVDIDADEEVALNLSLNNPEIQGHWTASAVALLEGVKPALGDDVWGDLRMSSLLDHVRPLIDDAGKDGGTEPGPTLAERFLVPPFSVLDARQGYWQDRKREWLALGIVSELGRDEVLLYTEEGSTDPVSQKIRNEGGTSVFDPVICELVYRWFSPDGGRVLDPFAGGSVRGIVAGRLGRDYHGIELRKEQVAANLQQRKAILSRETDGAVSWHVGDSLDAEALLPDAEPFDLVFSCPPYFDLEQYSDDARDLSNAGGYEDFLDSYRRIIAIACARLRPGRFACFVVGDIRDKRGFYRNFVSDTVAAFEDAGVTLYNEGILVVALTTLPLRAARAFSAMRKLGKAHQNVLVFYNGDPSKIRGELGTVEVGEIGEATDG